MKTKKELRGEFSAVLKKAYIQKESVDNVKDKKFTDPTGYEFLESWTWSWIEKQLPVNPKKVSSRLVGKNNELSEKIIEQIESYLICAGKKKKIAKELAEEIYWKAVSEDLEEALKAQENRPMGVSQWKNHGKKYGYWEYFEKEVVERFIDYIYENKSKKTLGFMGKLAWADVRDSLTKLSKEFLSSLKGKNDR